MTTQSLPSSTPANEKASQGRLASDAQELAAALHEVSNALTVILGWIERAKSVSHRPEEVERALDVAATRATAARVIVRRAIGAEVTDDGPCLAAALVVDAAMALEPTAREAGVRIETHVDPRTERLLVESAASITQILTNLLLNAISVSPRGGVITADLRPHAGVQGVRFTVADQGPGIPPERRRTLFTSGISTRPGGAGIGLRYAAGLARSCGGELSLADSQRGACFELFWPTLARGNEPSTAVREAKKPRSRLDGARILILEDDEAVIDLLDTVLTARGAEVVSVRNHTELEIALADGPFDAALFDISPILEDLQATVAAVRASNSALQVVLISGSALYMPELPPEWIAAWVRKPFEVSEIIEVLEQKCR